MNLIVSLIKNGILSRQSCTIHEYSQGFKKYKNRIDRISSWKKYKYSISSRSSAYLHTNIRSISSRDNKIILSLGTRSTYSNCTSMNELRVLSNDSRLTKEYMIKHPNIYNEEGIYL